MKTNADKALDSSHDNKPLNTEPHKDEVTAVVAPFNFLKVFIEHIKDVFKKFQGKNLSHVDNTDFIELGRNDEEKELIREMCSRVDEEYALLAELRASGLTPEDWIKKKGEEILEDCSPEEREEILSVVEDAGFIEVEEQADALESDINDIQETQEDSKEE